MRYDLQVSMAEGIYYIMNQVLTFGFLSSVLSVKGKKVLHIDKNDHYGGYVNHASAPISFMEMD